METWSWLVLGAVLVLALGAALADGTGRLRRGGARGMGGAADAVDAAGPRPGEIWWAAPSAADTGAGTDAGAVWLCLVLVADEGAARVRVAAVTSGADAGGADGAAGTVALPPGTLGAEPYRVETAVRDVSRGSLRRCAAELPPQLWERVRHLGG